MQSKGVIRFFTIVLAIVCIYHLSFTWVARYVESEAKEYAAGNTQKERVYLDSIASQPVYNLLFKKYTYAECRDNQINLGLDLKGGMNVTLEVSLVDLVKSLANYNSDTLFNNALNDALELQKSSGEDFVTLFGRAFENRSHGGRLAAVFATKELQDRISFNSTNEDVLKVIKKEADDAVDRSFNILRTRIDKFGVTQPNIQKIGSGKILIELPGIKEPERVRKLLQGTAKLEFWETYESKDILTYMADADKYLKVALFKTDTTQNSDTTAIDSSALAAKDTADSSQKTSLLNQIAGQENDTAKNDTSGGKKVSADPFKENPLFAVLQPAVNQDEKGQTFARKGPVIGYAAIKDTGKVNAYLAMPGIKAIFPKEFKPAWSVKPFDKENRFLELLALKVTNRDGRAPLEGDVITDARQDFGQFNNAPEISMSMNAEGAKIWKRLTGENIGKSVAIVLDNYVYSYPTVQGEIPSGRSSITGRFTLNEAKDLANILKAGKLPAPARIVEEAVVGPTLGKEAISSGLLSFVIALLLVLVFMVFYYSNAGWVADLALFANVFFLMGVLASLTAVLTLPGIAGLVLTIGMSVDANILIYERVREEIANGKGMRLAITDGFKHARSSIIDSNLTTLLTGVVLYVFGSGPIQGFATTLVIGILTSLFSAMFITRLIFEWKLEKNKVINFSTKFTQGMFKNINIDFVNKRKLYYIISGSIITVGIISMVVRGFNYGVDFKGGRTYVVRFEGNPTTVQVREALSKPFGSAPEVKTFSSSGAAQMKITTTYLINETSAEADDKVEGKLNAGLSSLQTGKYEIMSSQKVGPTIADDIKTAAFWAIFFSLIIIFLYILVRFKKWQYSLGAVIALAHDVLMVMTAFSLLHGIVPFSLEVDQAFIAALLTVIGYSINDTVVVYDRIREYLSLKLGKKDTMEGIINTALNATLSRTINTSLTIFFVLFAIFVFGGEVIRGFSFALLIGIIVGTYSSICIATPIVIDFQKKKEN